MSRRFGKRAPARFGKRYYGEEAAVDEDELLDALLAEAGLE